MNNENACLKFAINQSVSIYDIKCDIPKLKGDNYKIWREKILLHLGWMNIEYAIRKNKPSSISETNTPNVVDLYEKWERSNRLSVMFIKTNIYANIHSSDDQHEKVKDLLKVIDD